MDPCNTSGDAYTPVDVDDKKGLKQLAWAIYDGVLLPGDTPELEGQHDWVWSITGTYYLMFKGDSNFDHYPHALPCPLMLHGLGGPHVNADRLHLQGPHCYLEHSGP